MACLRSSCSLEWIKELIFQESWYLFQKTKPENGWKIVHLLNQSMLSCQVLGLPWWATCFVWIFWVSHGFEWPKGHLLGINWSIGKWGDVMKTPSFFDSAEGIDFYRIGSQLHSPLPTWKKSLKITSQVLQMNLSLLLMGRSPAPVDI